MGQQRILRCWESDVNSNDSHNEGKNTKRKTADKMESKRKRSC